MKRSPFPPGRTRATKVGEIIHVDTGLVPVPTVNGETCYANFKDDYSGWSVVKLMKKKSEIGEHLLAFIAFVETSTGKKVKIVRSDGAIELATNKLEQRFKELGIVHQKSCRHTPQQNSVVERDQRTSMEATRSTIYTRTNKWTNEFKNAPMSIKRTLGSLPLEQQLCSESHYLVYIHQDSIRIVLRSQTKLKQPTCDRVQSLRTCTRRNQKEA